MTIPDVHQLLDTAVRGIGGTPRPGQQRMAEAVAAAVEGGEHLVVQAGTGTGKSLAYLVPALRHAVSSQRTVVVATATIALQRQLIERDLPRLARALAPELGREPTFAILKGRSNYLCLHRIGSPPEEDEDDALFDAAPTSDLGRQVQRLHAWAQETETGDRDTLEFGVGNQAWRQVSVSAGECLGASACAFGEQCFAELARAQAGEVDIVVTNHALLAVDATADRRVVPEHSVLVIDEAHELADRVTSARVGLLTEGAVARAARRAARVCERELGDRLGEAGDGLALFLADIPAGRLDTLGEHVAVAVAAVRDAAARCITACGAERDSAESPDAGVRRRALASLTEVHDAAQRVLESFQHPTDERTEVVWRSDGEGRAVGLHVAPLSVSDVLGERLFTDRTVVLTSATLSLGGSFAPLARQWGLPPEGEGTPRWRGLDVGSPFDHARSGILYVARHLPRPGRDGLDPAYTEEIAGLVDAAGGRTLGLFSSMRAAERAAAEIAERVDHPVLCQGQDSTGRLVQRFIDDPRSCLFGTLSLWQGVDVPGPALQLVIVDRIPFPRPDDPLASARQRAAAARGGNGFMEVAATHAALLLAQGTGRLLRTATDRGVIAVLDPRLATARYGQFLRASLPPYWTTHDPEVARGALRRLDAAAEPAAEHAAAG